MNEHKLNFSHGLDDLVIYNRELKKIVSSDWSSKALPIIGILAFWTGGRYDIGFFIAVVYIVLSLPYTQKYLLSRQCAKQKEMLLPQTYVLNDKGLEMIQGEVTRAYLWAEMNSYLETESCFLLFINQKEVVFIPKKCFETADALQNARELLLKLPVYIKPKRINPISIIGMVVFAAAILFNLYNAFM